MKTLLKLALLLLPMTLLAQAPQIPLTGNIGSGFNGPLINSPAVVFATDADHTMVYPEMSGSGGTIIVTSTPSLTATRNLIAPNTGIFNWVVRNNTTGGQSINVKVAGGTGVSIANGDSSVVMCDTVNCYVPGGQNVTQFLAPTASWPSWLVPTVTNQYTTPSLAVTAAYTPLSAVTGTAPVDCTTSGSTVNCLMAQATSSVDGYLSSTDWNTFNGKQAALTNPVTGTGTTGYYPLFTGASTIGNGHLDDGVTTAGVITSTEPISVSSFELGAQPSPGANQGDIYFFSGYPASTIIEAYGPDSTTPGTIEMDLKSADRSHNTVVMVAHPTYTSMVNPVAIPVTGPLYGNGQSSAITLETTAQAQAALGTFSQYGLLTSPTTTSVGSLLPSSWTPGHTFVPVYQPSGSPITPTIVDLGSYIGTNVTAASPIVATPSITGVSLSCPTCGTSSGGTNVSVNGGSSLGNLNINATAPVADASYLAMTPKVSGSDMITEVPYATSSQYGVTLLGATGGADVYGAAAARQANLSLLPGTYTDGDMCTYASSGTLLNCNTAIPTVGTWGALNYPTWTTGTPFVKMTAAGTFALDTNSYLTSLSGALLATGATTGATSQAQVFTDGVTLSNLSSYSGDLPSIGSAGLIQDSGIAASNVFQLPSLTSGSVLYSNGSTIAQDNANFFWDATNHRLGIGTTGPGSKLVVQGSDSTSSNAALNVTNSGTTSLLYVRDDGNVGIGGTSSPYSNLTIKGASSAPSLTSGTPGILDLYSPTGDDLVFTTDSASPYTTSIQNRNVPPGSGSFPIALNPLGGNVGIGTTSPTHTLEVNGTFQSGTATLGAGSTDLNGSGVPEAHCLADGTNCPATPTVGTWGALNYPTWTTGTPFVKMTAAGTFALDTNSYLTSSGISGMTTGQLPVAASATTVTSSIAYATANTASTIVERDGSGNFSAGTITAALTGAVNGVTLSNSGAATSYLDKTGNYSTPAGAGTVTTSGSPVSPNIAAFSSGTAITAATSANIQTAIGAGVYDASGAAAARQANLSLLPGTYTDGDMCTYASSGTLLNCNTAIPSLSGALLATGATTGATSQNQVFTDGVTGNATSSFGATTDGGAGRVWNEYVGAGYGGAVFLTDDAGTQQGATRVWGTGYPTAGTNFEIDLSSNTQAYGSDPSSLTYAKALFINGATLKATFEGATSAGAGSTDYSTASSAQVAHCLADGTGCPSTTAAISGLTAGYIPLAGSATTLTGNSHIDDGVTVIGAITGSEPFILDYSDTARVYSELYNATGHAWFINSTGSSGYDLAPANSLSFRDGTGMITPLYLTSTSVVALKPVSMPTGSTVNSTAICLADGTGCPGGTVYNAAGTQLTSAHTVMGLTTLSGGAATVTFSGSAVFTSSSSYACMTSATVSTADLDALGVTYTSGSSVTFSDDGGLGSDAIRYICIGN